ncbi:hypothetical protein HanIR_Chr04g0167391 [Helianthus annuus]|nr:hypothetical protein HanIR_Chr04g0167391 [Helianthus annuus]
MHGTPDRGRDPHAQASDLATLPGGEYPTEFEGSEKLVSRIRTRPTWTPKPVLDRCRWPLG